jgi:glycosyltransferase involved in cell wall biosynthesis
MDGVAPKRVIVLGYIARDLISARGPLIRELAAQGHAVLAVASELSAKDVELIGSWNATAHSLPISRSKVSLFDGLRNILGIRRIIKEFGADTFFGYNVKPVIFGLIAATLCGVRRRVVMITGLGYAFTDGPELKRKILRFAISLAYRAVLPLAHVVVFQNRNDRDFFVASSFVKEANTQCVNGSGVDLAYYTPQALPTPPITFLMIARLLYDKGVVEYIEAARIVKKTDATARFLLIGPLDPNPAALRDVELRALIADGAVDYLGEIADIRPHIAACHVVVLPSYREGMPRTVLEALAMRRPVITTDVPGCRDSVLPGRTGWLVPARDAQALADAMLEAMHAPLETYAEAAVEDARNRFSAPMIANQVIGFL